MIFLTESHPQIYFLLSFSRVCAAAALRQSSRLAGLVSRVCSGFSDEARLEELRVFYEKYAKWIPVKTFHKIEESIRTNKAWLAKNEASVCAWVKAQQA